MGLTVLSVASPFAPVGTDADGAAEQVVAAVDAALTRAGHRSVVIAVEGAAVTGTLVSMPRVHGQPDHAGRAAVMRRVGALVARTVAEQGVDLVHIHAPVFAACLPPPGVPVLVTLHEPLDRYPREALTPLRPDTHLHGVSAAQIREAPPGVRLLPPIETGVAVDRLYIRVPKRRFVVALGRMEPARGFHYALDAAAEADIQLLLAGDAPAEPDEKRYFQDTIRPRLDGKRRYLGPVGFARKRWILGAGRCLLAATEIVEPTPLDALEALACGTPVVAFPTGALADLIEPGVNGFLVEDVHGMAEAIEAAETLDPDACRATVRARHSLEVMTARYLALYEELVDDGARIAGAG